MNPSPPASSSQSVALGLVPVGLANLRHSWRVSAAVVLGVATATAVIVGALLVGDSMRGSLRALTLERLGRIESIVVPGAFFDPGEIVQANVYPVALFSSASVEFTRDDAVVLRASNIQVLGVDANFWELDSSDNVPASMPLGDDIVVNESLAKELGVVRGDLVTLRLPVEQAVPADSPLGRRDSPTEGLPRLVIADVIADQGLGRFSLAPNQAAPQILFADRQTLLAALDREGQANMLLADVELSDADIRPNLSQLGLKLQRVTQSFEPDQQTPADETTQPSTVFDYYSVTSDRLLVPEPSVERIAQVFPEAIETLTYLANAIETVDASGNVIASVPYSIITAMDGSRAIPLDYQEPTTEPTAVTSRAPLVINDWTAQQLSASVGTEVRIAYFEPEVEKGNEVERYFDAVVTEIVPITEPSTPYSRRSDAIFDKSPTVYNDPNLTPTVPGVTDQESISDWDLPFALTRKIDAVDDKYWNDYRLTPKAFMPLAEGRRLFGSRFGQTTGVRLDPTVAASREQLEQRLVEVLSPVKSELGWAVIPIRAQQLAASRGTTPFDALFLSLSFFVILSAVMLIAMLFRLGIASRLREFGTMMALGWTGRRVASLVLLEGICLTVAGVLVGVVGGVAYASLVLWALRSWWVGAVTVPFLQFHGTPLSLVIGGAMSGIVALGTMGITIRSVTRRSAQSLLSGRDDEAAKPRSGEAVSRPPRRLGNVVALAMIAIAIVVSVVGATLSGQAAAGSFVGAGMMLLIATLVVIHTRLSTPERLAMTSDAGGVSGRFSLGSLAGRSSAKHPLRSTLTIGLMATASFLIIAITAFRLQPDDSGTGGFDLVAQSSQPLFRDLNDPLVRSELLGPDSASLQDITVAAMRFRAGQDASCNNLYQATQPTVLGVTPGAAEEFTSDSRRGKFQFASAAGSEESPWHMLAKTATGSEADPIPVIIDQNTAMWSLQMTSGVGEVRGFEYNDNVTTYFEVVGLLANSVLQGKLMIGEKNFTQAFPTISGYQYFLVGAGGVNAGGVKPGEAGAVLENRLGDYGMDVTSAHDLLAGMLAVQNTYLRTFQSLGALGLLLGTIGLAIAQLRSILERRGELAIMRAVGFTRGRLATLVLSETMVLLLIGIGCGVGCAVLAVLPHALASGTRPPIVEPLAALAGITLFGMFAAIVSLRRMLRLPLLESLRAQ